MATNAAKAVRRALVMERLNTLSSVVTESHGLEIPTFGARSKDPELQQIEELEAVASMLEALTAKKEGANADEEGRGIAGGADATGNGSTVAAKRRRSGGAASH